MAPRVSIGTPLCRPIARSSATTVSAARNAASTSPDFFSMTEVSVSWCSSNGPGGPVASRTTGSGSMSDLDQVGRILGDIGIGGEDSRYRFADISHVALCQRVSAGRPQAPRVRSAEIRSAECRAMSAWVQTAWTPGKARAAFASIVLNSPCATGERTTRICHWPGNEISRCKTALAGEERAILQTRDGTADKFPFSRHERNRSPFLHLFCRGSDCLDDVLIAGATTQIR